MQNTEFKQKLVTRGACQEALDWLGEQEPEAAWHGCAAAGHYHWLGWLVCRLPSLSPLWDGYIDKHDALTAEYTVKIKPLMAEYTDGEAPRWAEYDAKEALLWAECKDNRVALFYYLFPWPVVEQALLKDPVSSWRDPRTR